jgi:DNA-binding HxlR family transcriptional regulator
MASTPRTYGDRCGIARALDAVGERWALLVVRELLLGPKRFTDLRAGLPGASPNVLAQRLRELEAAGIAERRALAPPAASQVYALTARGAALEPVVLALGRWGAETALPPDDVTMSVDSHVLALPTLFDSSRAGDARLVVDLLLDGHPFRVEVADGRLKAERRLAAGTGKDADATVATDPATLVALVRGRETVEGARRAGALEVTAGDPRAVERLVALFPRPSA